MSRAFTWWRRFYAPIKLPKQYYFKGLSPLLQRIEAGDFESVGLLQQSIYNNPKEFDLDDPNIQLLIAIHYLTLNDQQKRTDKWE